ncbi:MAG: hypothetical protein AVDCRST_MAG96-1434 [uncultured Segetibacter sp.]|uniref:Uncharacterized protein n=1 Tax=uncultured Segetibacter sp. TaxID=481133 RepID=A0A6J4SE31_9BACT|nr:MAG: hypothetical protein AVDCRST_MAG96-1434 [uncultured Segetibacter sp.]
MMLLVKHVWQKHEKWDVYYMTYKYLNHANELILGIHL